MKALIKIFACSVTMTVAFLACDSGTTSVLENERQADLISSSSEDKLPIVNCKQSGVISLAVLSELEPSCNSEQKKLVTVLDMHKEETDWDHVGGDVSARYDSQTGEYIVNGERMSEKEYEDFMEDYWKRYYEQLKGKRDLPIPCVVSDKSTGWIALLTEEEIAELQKTYGELYFEYADSLLTSSDSNGENASCGISSSSQNTQSSSSSMKYPQMDERVAAYLLVGSDASIIQGSFTIQGMYSDYQINTDIDKLKESFPVALSEENFDPECDYFSIHITQGEWLSYYTISKNDSGNLILYNVHPGLEPPNPNLQWGLCLYPSSPRPHGFLICDKEGGLKDKITLEFLPTMQYNDPAWDCYEVPDPNPYFELRK